MANTLDTGCNQGVVVSPLNSNGDCSRTIKAQYQQSSRANFMRQDGLGATGVIETTYRIRKLTPRECFRLMGVDDNDIDKIQAAGISNSQQYKLAGNSIVVDVLYHIFRKAFCETHNENIQQTLF
jgi:site-specific DNA-cytosine methylase